MSVRFSSSFLTLAVLLAAIPATAQQRNDTATPDDVIVTGRQAPDLASAGTKSALPLAETAQSITVVTGDQIEALGLQNLNQALRFVESLGGPNQLPLFSHWLQVPLQQLFEGYTFPESPTSDPDNPTSAGIANPNEGIGPN